MNKILLIGTIPPPIGGVTIYVNRLKDKIKNIDFIDYKRNSLKDILIKIFYTKSPIHLNCSSPIFRFIIVMISRILNKKIITTWHGNLGRFNFILNYLDNLAIKYSTIPVVLNENSFFLAKKINKKSQLQSSFIPPLLELENFELDKEIKLFFNLNDFKFVTNASRVSFDKNGKEIYGIIKLINIFRELPKEYKLIISTPSKDYEKYLKRKNILIPDNVKMIGFSHSFFQVLQYSDVMIRATTTDGDSISIKEALYLKKKVIASNIVSREKGVFLYENDEDLKQNILNVLIKREKISNIQDGSKQVQELYKKIIEDVN